MAIFGPSGALVRRFRQKIAGTEVRRSPPPARRGCSAAASFCSASIRERSRPLRRGRVAEKPKLRSRSELSQIYAVAVPGAKKSLGQKLRSRAELSGTYDVVVFEMKAALTKVGLPCDAFDNL